MYSNNKKTWILIWSILIALLLFLGLWFHQKEIDAGEYVHFLGYNENGTLIDQTRTEASTTEAEAEPTTMADWIATEAEPTTREQLNTQNINDTGDFADITDITTSELGPEDNISENYEDASKAFYISKQEYETAMKNKKIFMTLSIICIVFGIIGELVLVICLRNNNVLLTIEGAVILLTMTIERSLNTDFSYITEIPILFIGLIMLPYAIHDIVRWISKGLSLKDSLSHRIGMLFSKRYNKPHLYLPVVTMWMIFLIVAGIGIGIGMYQSCYLVVGVFCAIIAFSTVVKYMNDLSHFERQIEQLSAGEAIEISSEIYANLENKLAGFKLDRDAAIENAVKSERFKVDLITNVSHDLRTPLSSILGYGELLEGEDLSTEGREKLNNLNKKTRYMRDLVDELFELTKISSGVIEPKAEELDLIKLIEQTIGLYEDKLTAGKLSIKRHFFMDKVQIKSDGAMLHQVLANLLGNAIKYSLVGSRIHIKADKDESGNNIIIRMSNVSSYEMDFDEEEIVQRFVRGDKARSTGGSGLGLAIAKTYTDALGGEFRIEIDDEQFVAIIKLPFENERKMKES